MTTSFPRQHARTRRFTLGRPRSFTVTADAVLFLRSPAGDDAVTDLWTLDLATGEERLLVAAGALLDDDAELPAAERARRERAREAAGGITSYATDDAGTIASFALAGRLYAVQIATGEIEELAPDRIGFDPRPSSDGTRVAFVDDEGLHVAVRGGPVQTVVAGEGVTWGMADFIAAEELQRQRGYWWSRDGERLAVTRVDESPVERWWIADPANPAVEPALHRYPAAGTANADVGLSVVELEARRRVDVRWDREALPYLADVLWREDGELTLVTLDRSQARCVLLRVDLTNGATEPLHEHHDPDWFDIVPGAPRWLPDGRLLTVVDVHDRGPSGTRTVAVDGVPLGPAGVQVMAVLAADAASATVVASDDPTRRQLATLDLTTGDVQWLTYGEAVHGGVVGDEATVVSIAPLVGAPRVEVRVGGTTHTVTDNSEAPVVEPNVRLLELGPRGLRGALLLPHADGDGPLPVLLDPYGGPHAQRVLATRNAMLTSQWFADQGYAVLVVDGAGTPARGPRFEREVRGDFASQVLADQLDGLAAAAQIEPRLDTSRVAIRGWSFGGYLAALAALRRPDVIRAAIVGAPVTDWRLYDTAYTERYLGHPDVEPEAYERSNLISSDGELLHAAPLADGVRAPGMLIIHGLADDNVVAAHSLRLSSALLAAGRPHEFLPLSGVTHMTPQEVVAENLLLHQVDFLARHLG